MNLPGEPAWIRWSRWVDRAYNAFTVIRDELALSRIHVDGMRRLVTESYGRNQRLYGEDSFVDSGLQDWEAGAIDRYFPPPPARLLVGGAGGGREVLALLAKGFQVDALEPTRELHERLQAAVARLGAGPTSLLVQGSYEDLVEGKAPALVPGRYDGVVLGWGSICHVRSASIRDSLLEAIARLCPHGPVMLSFSTVGLRPRGGRAEALRGGLRRALAALPGAQPVRDGDVYHGLGYEHAFSEAEVTALATRAGYRVALLRTIGPGFPHAVLTRS